MIYLASPYSDPDPAVMASRHKQMLSITAAYMRSFLPVFSPIVHCHELALTHSLPTDFEFWKNYCLDMLHASAVLYVIKLPGWEDSKGIKAEVAYAHTNLIPVE